MSVPPAFTSLVGHWQGTNRLWLDPAQPANESAATAVFQLVAQEKFATLHYTWADGDQPQSGVLLFGLHEQQVNAAWVDSWHMQDQIMTMSGASEADGSVWVQGSYAAPPGQDWGWRISLRPDSPDQFRLIMHNITPAGEEMLAVEVTFSRA